MNTPNLYEPAPQPLPAGLDDQAVSTAQQGIPVPWMCGTRKLAVHWISRIYNLRAVEASEDRPAKK